MSLSQLQRLRVNVSGNHTGLERELRAEGLTVLSSRSSAAALEQPQSGRCDAVVLDALDLESADFDLIRHARETDPNLAILLAPSRAVILPEQLEELAVACGADAALLDLRARFSARQVATAVTRRRARGKRAFDDAGKEVLIVEWDPSQVATVSGALMREGFNVVLVADGQSAMSRLRNRPIDVVLCPPSAEVPGARFVDACLRFDPRLNIVVVSAEPDLSDTVDALSAGAFDYLLEPVGPRQALGVVEAAWAARAAAGYSNARIPTDLRLLLMDDNPSHAALTSQLLAATSSLHVTLATTMERAASSLAAQHFDAILCAPESFRRPPLRVIHELRAVAPAVPLLILSELPEPPWGARAMRMGVEDIVGKARIGREGLPTRIANAVMRASTRAHRHRLLLDVQLREASQQEVVRRSLDGMIVIDARDFVVFANPAAERMFGCDSGELLGNTLPIELNQTGPVEVEIRGEKPTFAEYTRVEVDWNGATASLVTLRDVTERRNARRLREQLAHSERLAAIGQMAAGVAHEINNPAAYVVANLVAMRERLTGANRQLSIDAEGVAQLLEMVDENLQGMRRIQSITSDLRTFSRIDSDEVQLVDVNECIDIACKIAFNEIRQRAQLIKRIGVLPSLAASPGKLAQVFTNLLVNAAQAIPEGNAADNRITIVSELEGQQIVVTVEDTGCGISEAARHKLFDAFFTTKEPGQGTGLGLSLCADIVRGHKGTIKALDAKPHGARFEVRLPLRDALRPRTARAAPLTPVVLSRPLRLLLIDDEPLVLRALSRMLSRHEVVTARGASQALERLADDSEFDLIICDLMMPEMDGPALHEKLLEIRPALVERLVFCSGGAFTPRAKSFLEASACPLLHKPMTLDDFEHVAAEMCVPHVS